MRQPSSAFLFILLMLTAVGTDSLPAEQPPTEPPYKRLLTGDDTRRVAELEKHMHQLYAAGKFADAEVPAREIMALRTQAQGADHWQTADVRRDLETFPEDLARSLEWNQEAVFVGLTWTARPSDPFAPPYSVANARGFHLARFVLR